MKKKTKKLTKEQVLKEELSKTQQELRDVREDKTRYQDVLNQIERIFNKSERYDSRIAFKDLPEKIMVLEMFKRHYEGSYNPMMDVVNSQREIIRWLIKPSTAEKPKPEILEEYRKKGML